MTPISGVNTGTAAPLTEAGYVPKVQKPEEEVRPKPVIDEYTPQERQEPSGRYRISRDEEGRRKIYFDGPPQSAESPEGPEKGSKSEGRCTGDTGKADREIEKLKKRRQELEQQLATETDESRIKDLERQLAQVEQELYQKDNDAYRRRHTRFS